MSKKLIYIIINIKSVIKIKNFVTTRPVEKIIYLREKFHKYFPIHEYVEREIAM